jgi:hypothetical protein
VAALSAAPTLLAFVTARRFFDTHNPRLLPTGGSTVEHNQVEHDQGIRQDITTFSAILGIPLTATRIGIKQAHWRASRRYHPDTCKDKDTARRYAVQIAALAEAMTLWRHAEDQATRDGTGGWPANLLTSLGRFTRTTYTLAVHPAICTARDGKFEAKYPARSASLTNKPGLIVAGP